MIMSLTKPTTPMPFRPSAVLSADRRRTPMLMFAPGKIVTSLRLNRTIGGTHRCDTLSALPINPPIASFYRLAVHHPR